ncbi:MAG: ATP-binding protein [Actinomycetota bacterium]|nr:ATP-binding protein [Actinomycetota bacterium]
MQITLDGQSIPEIIAILGSVVIAVTVLVTRRNYKPARLFALFCLSAMLWKAFEFAYPQLTQAFWVDAIHWALGALSLALSLDFLATYVFQAEGGKPLLEYIAYPPALLLIIAGALGWIGDSVAWKGVYGIFYLVVVITDIVLITWAYYTRGREEFKWAMLGTLLFALGAGINMLNLIWDFTTVNTQTYGMIAFLAFFGYDILVAGFLREQEEHLQALEELGLREERLERAEDRFRRLMDDSFDIIFTISREGDILAINTEAEEVVGFPVEKLLGKGYLDYLNSEDQRKIALALDRGLRGEKVKLLEITLTMLWGKPVILQLTGTRLFQDEVAALMIARDITESRKMEQQLQQRNLLLEEANRRLRELDTLKTELVGIVGHELRSPLTVIYSYVTALKDHWVKMPDDRKIECVEHVIRECNRLNRMVENVLDMSRIESERLFLNKQNGDLVAMLADVTGEMAMTPGSRPIHLTTSDRPLELVADWDKIKQVVINLLDNAFRFTPPDSQVMITAGFMDGNAVVRIEDQGPGIPFEDRDRLFDRFTQHKAQGMERGLGLGLYIVRTFVEAHGGEVWLEDAEERGSVVAFSIPLEV